MEPQIQAALDNDEFVSVPTVRLDLPTSPNPQFSIGVFGDLIGDLENE